MRPSRQPLDVSKVCARRVEASPAIANPAVPEPWAATSVVPRLRSHGADGRRGSFHHPGDRPACHREEDIMTKSKSAHLAAMLLLSLTSAYADEPETFDATLQRTPYQPDGMLSYPPANPATDNGPYGFNLLQYNQISPPCYYEYRDRIDVVLYINSNGVNDSDQTLHSEKNAMKKLDKMMPKIVEELNRWVGGRLVYKSYSGAPYDKASLATRNEIGIHFNHTLDTVGLGVPNRTRDARGAVYQGGDVHLAGGRLMDEWTMLLGQAVDGDDFSEQRVYALVMHELCHCLGLSHYYKKVNGRDQVMETGSTLPSSDHDVDKILGRGDKAGLLSMAGFPKRAKDCFEDGNCREVWNRSTGKVVFPSAPVDFTYDLRHR
jgi:hypothetical protein